MLDTYKTDPIISLNTTRLISVIKGNLASYFNMQLTPEVIEAIASNLMTDFEKAIAIKLVTIS